MFIAVCFLIILHFVLPCFQFAEFVTRHMRHRHVPKWVCLAGIWTPLDRQSRLLTRQHKVWNWPSVCSFTKIDNYETNWCDLSPTCLASSLICFWYLNTKFAWNWQFIVMPFHDTDISLLCQKGWLAAKCCYQWCFLRETLQSPEHVLVAVEACKEWAITTSHFKWRRAKVRNGNAVYK